jgi:putative transposase
MLDQVGQFRGYPKAIRTDQGAGVHQPCLHGLGARARRALPDQRRRNAHAESLIESFNGKFRDECLNEQWFQTLHQIRKEISRWRRDYNEVRPRSAIRCIQPAQFAAVHRRHADDAQQSPEVS